MTGRLHAPPRTASPYGSAPTSGLHTIKEQELSIRETLRQSAHRSSHLCTQVVVLNVSVLKST